MENGQVETRLLGVTSVLNLTGDLVNDLTRVWGEEGGGGHLGGEGVKRQGAHCSLELAS